MSYNNHSDNRFSKYSFHVRSEHIAPLLTEPIIQLAVQIIGYIGITYMAITELVKQLKLVNYAELALTLLGIYCAALVKT